MLVELWFIGLGLRRGRVRRCFSFPISFSPPHHSNHRHISSRIIIFEVAESDLNPNQHPVHQTDLVVLNRMLLAEVLAGVASTVLGV